MSKQDVLEVLKKHKVDQAHLVAERLLTFAERLTRWSKVHNLTANHGVDACVASLILPSIELLSHLKGLSSGLDIGSGGGIPGLVLAMCQPSLRVTLLDKVLKKYIFLSSMQTAFELDNVKVVRGDFCKLCPLTSPFDALITRGSAPLDVQLRWTEKWRGEGIPLYSVQTPKSLGESALLSKQSYESFSLASGEFILVVVR